METLSALGYPYTTYSNAYIPPNINNSRQTNKLISSAVVQGLYQQPSILFQSKNTLNQKQSVNTSFKNQYQSNFNNISMLEESKNINNGMRMTSPKMGYTGYSHIINEVPNQESIIQDQSYFGNNYIMSLKKHQQISRINSIQCWWSVPLILVLSIIIMYCIFSHHINPYSQNSLKYFHNHPDKIHNPQLLKAVEQYQRKNQLNIIDQTNQDKQTNSPNSKRQQIQKDNIKRQDPKKEVICKQGQFLKDGRCFSCPEGFEWNGSKCLRKKQKQNFNEGQNQSIWNKNIFDLFHQEVNNQ